MATRDIFDGQIAGGYNSYPDRASGKIFFGSKKTKSVAATILSGQVIKAYTFLESDSAGKLKVHGNLTESANVTFTAALTSGQTLIMAGLTFTSGASGTTVAQLAKAWSNNGLGIPVGTGYAALTGVTNALDGGTFTAGTLTGYSVEPVDANTVAFNSTAAGTNATDVAATGTGTAPTITISSGANAFAKIAGVTIYDVDATAGDVDAEVYVEAPFWADDDGTCALRWSYDPSEVLTKADGSTVAVTAYNTGCSGITASSNLLKKKFVEGSEFELKFTRAGDKS